MSSAALVGFNTAGVFPLTLCGPTGLTRSGYLERKWSISALFFVIEVTLSHTSRLFRAKLVYHGALGNYISQRTVVTLA